MLRLRNGATHCGPECIPNCDADTISHCFPDGGTFRCSKSSSIGCSHAQSHCSDSDAHAGSNCDTDSVPDKGSDSNTL